MGGTIVLGVSILLFAFVAGGIFVHLLIKHLYK